MTCESHLTLSSESCLGGEQPYLGGQAWLLQADPNITGFSLRSQKCSSTWAPLPRCVQVITRLYTPSSRKQILFQY